MMPNTIRLKPSTRRLKNGLSKYGFSKYENVTKNQFEKFI